MRSELSELMVIVRDSKAEKLHEKSYFGNLTDEGLQLSLIEAFYLMEKDKIKIYQSNELVNSSEMEKILIKNDLFIKYLVFKDLRNRGYIVKTGFKYGSEFRLYERGSSPGDGHSNFLVKVISENSKISSSDFSSYVRVAHGVNKKLLLAVVDEEGDITYYNIEWMRP
ncbi:MAG: tRNA-intron lyase [Methanomicrobiales archaeon]